MAVVFISTKMALFISETLKTQSLRDLEQCETSKD